MPIAFGAAVTRGVPGQNPLWTEVDVTFDNSYPAGGYSVTPANVGYVNDVRGCTPQVIPHASGVILAAWDEATNKIRFYNPTGGTQVSPATPAQPVAVVTPDAGAISLTGSVAKPALTAVVTPGLGKEVPTGADLSGVGTAGLVKMMFFGS